MKALSPSAEKICAQALAHFAERGYDASSLTEIAEACGIRKASLYAHFSGKDEIYAAAFERALTEEREHVARCFQVNAGLPGDTYLEVLQARYAGQPSLRFLLRTVFFPPAPLRDVITKGFEAHLDDLRGHFTKQCAGIAAPDQRDELAEVYLAIVDSLHVELFYGNAEVYNRRLVAVRRLLALGIAHGK
ncbi:TetR/AcrR family transcriptional regulator [Klebsiella electrica]